MKTLLTASLAVSLLGYTATAGTVAYYEFNGSGVATVGSTVTDSYGTHNGTVAGGDLLYGSDPIAGSYLHFAADGPSVGGAGNRIVVPGSSDLLFAADQAFTIEAVFRTTQTLTNGVLISKGADVSNPDSQWWLRHQGNGQLRGDVEGVTGGGVEDNATSTGTPLINDGLWHEVAVVFDGTLATKTFQIYIDGVLRGYDTSVLTSGIMGGDDNDPVVIGEFASLAANRSFEGDIASIRISNAALTPGEFLVVPEPSTCALLLLGVVGGLCWRRK